MSRPSAFGPTFWEARQKYKTQPQLVEPVRLPAKIPTPEELDVDERLDRALAISNQLLQDATEQQAKRCVAPAELAPSEQAEKNNAEAWTRSYEIANRTNDHWTQHNECHDGEVMDILGDLETRNSPIPANLEAPIEPKTPTIDQLSVPDQSKHWLKGSWEFREYRDADFVAAKRAEQRALRQPTTYDLAGHNRASSEPASNTNSGATGSNIWTGKFY
ncbi:hypothetical protein PRZ48_003701 [Zasmidium cellare]|uniref:Uncharacterized protein n=1 Tax=Zasmidium cellare TaxID=395010 RepID=A0ABR0EX35_ZASCE|nr:hypothetical protein PRZ48_003701 [Zasmidium cellare]